MPVHLLPCSPWRPHLGGIRPACPGSADRSPCPSLPSDAVWRGGDRSPHGRCRRRMTLIERMDSPSPVHAVATPSALGPLHARTEARRCRPGRTSPGAIRSSAQHGDATSNGELQDGVVSGLVVAGPSLVAVPGPQSRTAESAHRDHGWKVAATAGHITTGLAVAVSLVIATARPLPHTGRAGSWADAAARSSVAPLSPGRRRVAPISRVTKARAAKTSRLVEIPESP